MKRVVQEVVKSGVQSVVNTADIYRLRLDEDNNKLNEFNLYSNFEQNVQCDCISESTNKQCQRRSSYRINGKNYCNQHSRSVIEKYIGKGNRKNVSKYGEYGNVQFDDEQYEKLINEFPNDYEKRIQSLDDYIQSSGKKYKDHLATIRNWARKEGYKKPEKIEYQTVSTEGLTNEEYEKLLRERRKNV